MHLLFAQIVNKTEIRILSHLFHLLATVHNDSRQRDTVSYSIA